MDNLDDILQQVEVLLNDYDQSIDQLVLQRMDGMITALRHLPALNFPSQQIVEEVMNNLSSLKVLDGNFRNNSMLPTELPQLHVNPPQVAEQNGCGRPKFNINRETLLGLRTLGNSWADISRMLSVSRWTIYRRARVYGIQDVGMFSIITDEELLEVIEEFQQQQSRLVGFPLVYGYLKSVGIHVQQNRVKNCLRRVDPIFNQLRWATLIHRREYNVRAPNSLWHIDGHHSLVKYGFVVHGSIDGFSRLITFLHCSTNNRSSTVLALFERAIADFGIPSRIRTDHGGENVLIWDLMETLRGHDRGSALRGTSTQNQRIERLWRDVFRCVSCTYYYLFQSMEDSGVLQLDNAFHKLILHFIFKPRINKSLTLFADSWNHHPLRTAKNRSPMRIWQNGMLDVRNRNLNTVQAVVGDYNEPIDDLEWYGYDPNAPIGQVPEDLNQVVVEDLLDGYVCLENYLSQRINPLQESQSFGVDLYIQALDYCNQLIEEL